MRDDEGLRVPPHSMEAEQSVLGGLLLADTAWDRIGDMIDSRDFYRSEYGAIYAAIGTIIAANKPADVVTVHEELKRIGKLDELGEAGSLKGLNALAQSVPSAANIRRYAEIVREHAEHRALIAAVGVATDIAWSEDGTPAEKLDRIGTVLANLERRGMPREPRALETLLGERLEHYTALAEGETVAGIPTGIDRLDRALGGGLKPGKVVVLGARPTVGKTSLAGHIAEAVASNGHVVLFMSQEMTSGELVDRFIANATGVQLASLTSGHLAGEDWSKLSETADRLRGRPIFIDDTPALTLHQIRAKARQVRRQHGGLALVIVDYLQLCASPAATERRHHQVEAISRGMKQLAKELDVCVLLLSQLNRASTDRPDSEPEMSDLKESGAIEEDADTVLLLHPMGNEADKTLLVLLKVAKNRQGKRGRFALNFDGRLQRWRESTGNVERRTK
jgi:replicative DNA helicase